MLRRTAWGLTILLGGCWAFGAATAELRGQDNLFAPVQSGEPIPMPPQASAAPSDGPGWGPAAGSQPYFGGYGYGSPVGEHGGPHGGDPCCEPCCDPCCDWVCAPVCVATQSFVYMARTSPNESLLVRSGIDAVVDASELEFDYEAGLDVSALMEDQYGLGTEVRILALDEYTDDVQVENFTGPNLFINTFLIESPGTGSLTPLNPPAFTLPQDFSVLYSSETAAVELNYHEPWSPKLRMFMGVRYARLDEEMILGTRDAVNRQILANWVTDNDLFGFQIGGHYILWHDHSCRLEAVGRGGIFYNDASVQVHSSASFDDDVGFGEDRNSEEALLGDFKLQMICQLCPAAAVTLGYQMMGFDGVLLASEQLSTTGQLVAQANNQNNIVEDILVRLNPGSVVFHGVFLGVEIRH